MRRRRAGLVRIGGRIERVDQASIKGLKVGSSVRIKNGKGDVLLDAKSTGPFFLVRMPPGTYHVEATLEDKAISKKGVTVPSKGSKRVVFVFPQGTD